MEKVAITTSYDIPKGLPKRFVKRFLGKGANAKKANNAKALGDK